MKRPIYIFLACIFWMGMPLANGQTNAEIRNWKRAADKGDAKAMYRLAQAYEKRKPEATWLRRALLQYEQAAALNFDSAQFAAGNMYEFGRGGSQNFTLTQRYYQAAADQGHAEAAYRLATLYEKGAGGIIPAEPQLAIKYYLVAYQYQHPLAKQGLDRLADVPYNAPPGDLRYLTFRSAQGHAPSQLEMGKRYLAGNGVEKNSYQGFQLIRDAARKNHPEALFELGNIYLDGLQGPQVQVEKNIRLAVSNFVKAANLGFNAAEVALASYNPDTYLLPTDPDLIQYRANRGGENAAEANYQMYLKYMQGDGVTRDPVQAMEYCQRAALAKHIPSMLVMARSYDNGFVVRQSAENAFAWYQAAAQAGNDSAQFVLAERYATGRGINQDPALAVRWYLRVASSQSGELASRARTQLNRYNIGDYVQPNELDYVKYIAGNGNTEAQLQVAQYLLEQNDPGALTWLRLAAEEGNAPAARQLGEVYLKGLVKQIPDNREAARWYAMAAEKDDIPALIALANMFSQNKIYSEGSNFARAKQLSDRYMALTANNPSERDPFIYKAIGDINAVNNDYLNAIANYASFINKFDEKKHRHIDLVAALDTRAIAHYNINKLQEALDDLEIAMAKLETFRNAPDVAPKYALVRAILHYRLGRVSLEMKNIGKACSHFQQAQGMGIQVEAQYLNQCPPGR